MARPLDTHQQKGALTMTIVRPLILRLHYKHSGARVGVSAAHITRYNANAPDSGTYIVLSEPVDFRYDQAPGFTVRESMSEIERQLGLGVEGSK